MFVRLAILFLPSLVGLLWQDNAGLSIVWSISGSFLIAAVAQTEWFKQEYDNAPLTHRLLRPTFMYHFFFVGYHVVGAVFSSLDLAGYSFGGKVGGPSESELSLNATAQALMLLAHGGVTAGMKLANLRYPSPKYVIVSLPPYRLLVVSLVCLPLGTALSFVPGLFNFSDKVLQIASTAVLVELTFAIAQKRMKNAGWTLALLCFNLISQMVSGWKGLVLWTMMTLGALLYPLMPRKVLSAGAGFVLFWALYFHPFGLALRPLIWNEGADRNKAVEYSMEHAINMSLSQRLDEVWMMMAGRVNDLYQFRKYLDYVPDIQPYFGLDLILQAHMALVPRIFWPEKPDLERVSMEIVYDAGVVTEDSIISAKENYYQDAYLSAGWLGIILACLFLGFAAMFVSRLCEQLFGGYEIGTCLIFTSLFVPAFINGPPNFLYFMGTLFSAVIVMFAAFAVAYGFGWLVPAERLYRSAVPREDLVQPPIV